MSRSGFLYTLLKNGFLPPCCQDSLVDQADRLNSVFPDIYPEIMKHKSLHSDGVAYKASTLREW